MHTGSAVQRDGGCEPLNFPTLLRKQDLGLHNAAGRALASLWPRQVQSLTPHMVPESHQRDLWSTQDMAPKLKIEIRGLMETGPHQEIKHVAKVLAMPEPSPVPYTGHMVPQGIPV